MSGKRGIKATRSHREKITQLSSHLFWDVDRDEIDFRQNKKFIIQRVLEYGLLSDWQIIYKLYGLDDIAKTAMSIRDLDKKTLAFISLLSKIPENKFACYTQNPSVPQHWNF